MSLTSKAQVQSRVKEISRDKANLNGILDVIEVLTADDPQPQDEPVLVAATKGVVEILVSYMRRGEARFAPQDDDEDDGDKKRRQVAAWIRERIAEVNEALTKLVATSDSEHVTQFAIVGLFRLMQCGNENNGQPGGKRTAWGSPDSKGVKAIVEALLSNRKNRETQIKRFQEFTDFWDVKDHLLRHLGRMIKKIVKEKTDVSKEFKTNLVAMLEVINFSHPTEEELDSLNTLLCHDASDRSIYDFSYDTARKSFSDVWENVLRIKLSPELYKRVLLMLNEKVMPFLLRPLLLTDFLINSYSVGGSISILALNGVFTLMQEYHLEYPDFYSKLYALFQPEVLHVKYRARFFHMADLFLTSSHLPEYLVAAFAKRLSRIALTAPANALLMVFPFIGNLMLRHKGLTRMIHGRTEDQMTADAMDSDPYDMSEPDPSKCRAMDSSLWEIQTLQSHVLPQVAAAAKFISKKLPEMEWDLAEYLEISWEDMLKVETKKKIFVNVPLTFERPDKGLMFNKGDLVAECFELK